MPQQGPPGEELRLPILQADAAMSYLLEWINEDGSRHKREFQFKYQAEPKLKAFRDWQKRNGAVGYSTPNGYLFHREGLWVSGVRIIKL